MSSYLLERARSGVSHCTGHCKQIIPKDHYRLGSVSTSGFSRTFWRCLPCITKRQVSNIGDACGSVGSFVDSLDNVPAEDKVLLNAYFQAIADQDEEKKQRMLAELLPRHDDLKITIKVGKHDEEEAADPHPPVTAAAPSKRKPKRSAEDVETSLLAAPTHTAEHMMPLPGSSALPWTQPPAPILTELEISILVAVGTLGTPDKTAVHEWLAKNMGKGYKKGPVTSAIGRCFGKGIFQSLAAPTTGGEPLIQVTAIGIIALQKAADKKQQAEAQQAAQGVGAAALMGDQKEAAQVPPPPKKKAKSRANSSNTAAGPRVAEAGRVTRALKEAQRCLHVSAGGTEQHPRIHFTVQGGRGNNYQVLFALEEKEDEKEEGKAGLALEISCTCPDAFTHRKTTYCKHEIFIALRELNLDVQSDGPLPVDAVAAALIAKRAAAAGTAPTRTPLPSPVKATTGNAQALKDEKGNEGRPLAEEGWTGWSN